MRIRFIIEDYEVTKQQRDEVELRWEDVYTVSFSTYEGNMFQSAINKLEQRREETQKENRIRELKEELRRLEGE